MPRRHQKFNTLLFATIILGIGLWFGSATRSPAAPNWQETPPAVEDTTGGAPPGPEGQLNLSLADDYCLGCHAQPGQTFELQNGDLLDLTVDPELHRNSVHGELGYACVQCHSNVGEYPHPPFEAADRRDAALQMNGLCQRCHSHQFELAGDDVHNSAQEAGIREAAVCIDCHTAHEVRRLTDPQTKELLPDTRQWIPERCALCHSLIYEKYHDSVHGSALSSGNRDVPTCIDCHGVHNIEDPTTAYYRLRSPQICAECHTDSTIMTKYGISTNVLDTYVADFHGTTVAIFEKQSPDAEVNKAVCYDCHGVHDIASTRDPESGIQMRTNLLQRCQVCHPDATENFPSSWMSHYIPSPDNYPLVYWIDVFYKFFIPVVLGGMGALVVLDAGRAVYERRRRSRKPPIVTDATAGETAAEPAAEVEQAAPDPTATEIDSVENPSPDSNAPTEDTHG